MPGGVSWIAWWIPATATAWAWITGKVARLAAKALIASLAARVVRGKAGGRVGCVCVERPDGMSDRRFR